jgi:class 3 adenylate cyclase
MEQRLATCLHADVYGYCRLIADDVEATVRTLTTYRTMMSNIVSAHGGRIADTAGDSLLAEFPSVSGAVRCAVDIQREVGALNAQLPPRRRVEFRVGIALGHVLVEEGRIYGDCVNIAARVQEMAAPGSVCVAGSVHDHVDGPLPVCFDYLGERSVKNIDTPVRIYRVDCRQERAGAPAWTADPESPGTTVRAPLCLGRRAFVAIPGLGAMLSAG